MEACSALEAVPLNVLVEIGKRLDIKSITRFASTNKNYRKLLDHQNNDLCRAIYSNQYGNHKRINDSNIDWQLCRTHCYNRLKEPSYEHVSTSSLNFAIDYLTNKVTYESHYGRGDTSEIMTVAAELPLRPLFRCGTIGYFEITVTADFDNEGYAHIGLTEDGIVLKGQAVGWTAKHTWIGYHGDDGDIYDPVLYSAGRKYGPRWLQLRHKATVGCLINFTNNRIAFTVNGQCHDELKLNLSADLVRRLHPVVGTRENVVIECNFGSQPFKYDLKQYDLFRSDAVDSIGVLATDE